MYINFHIIITLYQEGVCVCVTSTVPAAHAAYFVAPPVHQALHRHPEALPQEMTQLTISHIGRHTEIISGYVILLFHCDNASCTYNKF